MTSNGGYNEHELPQQSLGCGFAQNGMHYWFTDKDTMQAEINDGQFLEFAHVHDNIYGTSIRAVRDVAAQGKCCILDIDVQGARQVRPPRTDRSMGLLPLPPQTEQPVRRLWLSARAVAAIGPAVLCAGLEQTFVQSAG